MVRRIAPALAAATLLLAACGGSGPAIEDPREIMTQGIEATTQLNSAHVAVTLDGTASIPGAGSEMTLDGTTVEGDFDLEASQAHFSFSAMGFTGELIQDGADSYVKMPLTGPKWLKSTTTSGDPTSDLSDPTAMLDGLRDFLDTDGVELEKLSETDCGDGRCYSVRLTIPADALSDPGSVAGLDPSAFIGDGLVLDLLFDRDDLWLTEVSTRIGNETVGQLTVRVTLSAFNEDVSIEIPSPDEVTEDGGSLFGL